MKINSRLSPLAFATTIALGGALHASASFAQTAPAASYSWYGRIDLALESNDNGTISRSALQNFSSRLGVRGEAKFGADLSGIFQVETGVAPDDTTQSKTFASRNSYVGIRSQGMGTVLMGTHDMPLKSLEGTANQLWGEGEAMEVIIHGKGSSTSVGSSVFSNVHTRKTNVLLYTSPKFNDIVAKLAYSPDEGALAAAGAVPAYGKDMMGASVEFNNGVWNAGVATQSQQNFISPTATVGGKSMKASKATVGLKMGDLSAGVAFSALDNSAGRKTNNWLATGSYLIGPVVLKANFGSSGESLAGALDGVKMSAFEADYALDKAFTLYSYYAQINNAAKAKATLVAADNFPAVVSAGSKVSALGVGIRFNF